jgi:hypothetical protein
VPAPGRPNANHLWETRDGKLLMSNSATLFQYDADEDRFRPAVRDFNAFSYPYAVQEGNFLWVSANGGTVLNCYDTNDFSLVASFPTSHIVYHLCDAGNGELWMSGMGRMSIFDTRTRTWKELPEAIRNESRLMQGDIDIIYNVDDRSMLLNVIGNFALFIPTGIVTPILYRNLASLKKVTLTGFLISLTIEIIQLPFAVRASDVDDLILNTAGCLLGYALYRLFRRKENYHD